MLSMKSELVSQEVRDMEEESGFYLVAECVALAECWRDCKNVSSVD